MVTKWFAAMRSALAVSATPAGPARLDIARFGIGFCPGCKRLRGAASTRCSYCGSIAPVTADA